MGGSMEITSQASRHMRRWLSFSEEAATHHGGRLAQGQCSEKVADTRGFGISWLVRKLPVDCSSLPTLAISVIPPGLKA